VDLFYLNTFHCRIFGDENEIYNYSIAGKHCKMIHLAIMMIKLIVQSQQETSYVLGNKCGQYLIEIVPSAWSVESFFIENFNGI